MKFPVDASKKDVIKTFNNLGFKVVREGNHIIMERTNSDGSVTPLVMPNHKTINSGTLWAIVNQIGLTRDEFLKAFSNILFIDSHQITPTPAENTI